MDNLIKFCYAAVKQAKCSQHILSVDDIYLTGSHAYAYNRAESDVDLVVSVQFDPEYVHKHVQHFAAVRHVPQKQIVFISDISCAFKKFDGYNMPFYSLINKQFKSFNIDHLFSYISTRDHSWHTGRSVNDVYCIHDQTYLDKLTIHTNNYRHGRN